MSSIADVLERDGQFVYRTSGVSMEPMLRQDRDLVVVKKAVSRPEKYDVVLYRRGDAYVLHRVIGERNGCLRIRGDNTFSVENVPYENVIGVLAGFQRKGKHYTADSRPYRFYARFWNAVYPFRAFYARIRRFAVNAAKKAGIAPGAKKISGRDGRKRK